MKEKKQTIDDIAEELKISKTTVSRAISGKGRISEGTRAKVMAYIEKAGYKGRLLTNKELGTMHGFNALDYRAETLADCGIFPLPSSGWLSYHRQQSSILGRPRTNTI